MSARLRPTLELAFVGLLIVIGAGLRFYSIGTELWYDEIVTLVESVRAPLAEIVSRFAGDNHHPLYSVLAHLTVAVFGESPWALRLPAALFGIVTIPLLYLLGVAVTSRLEAGAAALILTVSYHHIWFSQNARGYTAVLFVVLVSTYALVRWLDTGRRMLLVVYAISIALGAYAHLTTVLVAVGQALACAIEGIAGGSRTRARTEWRPLAAAFAGAAALTGLVYAPMLVDVGTVLSSGESSGGEKTAISWTMRSALQGLQVGFGAAWGIGVGMVVFLAGGWSHFRQRPVVALLFALPVLATVAAALFLNRPVRPRFVFFAVGFALLFTVRGASVLGALAGRLAGTPAARAWGPRLMVALLTAGALALSIRSLPYGYRYPKQDYVQAVAFVERAKHDADIAAAVADGGAIPVVRYLGRPWPRVDTAAELQALRDKGAPVWLVSTFPSYIQAGRPDLWAILTHQCTEMHRIGSTVDDGSISIHRCP